MFALSAKADVDLSRIVLHVRSTESEDLKFMRPWTIVYFERLFVFTLVLGIPHAWLSQDLFENVGEVLWTLASTTAISGFLVFMISRRRSKIAKWVLTAMTVFGLLFTLWLFLQGVDLPLSIWIAPIQYVGQIAAVALLFLPSSRQWFQSKDSNNNLMDRFS